MWLVLPFEENLTFDNLPDSQKIAPTNTCFKSNMIIQCLINIFYQYQFLMKRIYWKTQVDNLYRYSVKIKATSFGIFQSDISERYFSKFPFFIYFITQRYCSDMPLERKNTSALHVCFIIYVYMLISLSTNIT